MAKDEIFEVDVYTIKTGKEVVEVDSSSAHPRFALYDVLIQNCNDLGNGGSWPKQMKADFEKYMRAGGAMYVYHSANNAFANWPEYNKMIALAWRDKDFGSAVQIKDEKAVLIPAGKGESTGHGPRRDVLITRLGEHEIHRGLPKQWLAADLEVYRYARGPAENMQVLSYAKDLKTGLNFPIEWLINYGEGRIYNSTYGHYWKGMAKLPPSMRCVAFQTIFIRSLKWLAGEELSAGMPEAFPSARKISLSLLKRTRVNGTWKLSERVLLNLESYASL